MSAPELPTRQLTGVIPWPFTVLAGGPDCGKTYTAYEASNSELVNRSFLLAYGEQIHEDYLPIAPRLEVVEHDGTIQQFTDMVAAASAQPRGEDGRPNLLIIDGGGRSWEALSNQAQFAARVRQARKQQGVRGRAQVVVPPKGDVGLDEAEIHQDLWNAATDRWNDIVDICKKHDGPVIMTTILKEVTIVNRGRTEQKWTIEGQKRLRSDCTALVTIPRYREFYVSRVKSLHMQPLPGDLGDTFTRDNAWQGDFSFDAFWKALGVSEASTAATQTFVEREQGNTSGIFTGENLKEEVRARIAEDARTNGPRQNPLAVLDALWEEVGGELTLKSLRVETKDEAMDGAEYLTRLRAHYLQRQAGAPTQGAHQQTAPTPNAPTAPTPDAPQTAPSGAGQGAPTAPAEPAGRRAAAAQTKADVARSGADKDRYMAMLRDEAEYHAEVFQVDAGDYIAGILATRQGADSLDQLPPTVVSGWLVSKRPEVADALRQQSRATEAAALEKAGGAVLPIGQLNGTGQNAPAREASKV